jgi:hypothetical protein
VWYKLTLTELSRDLADSVVVCGQCEIHNVLLPEKDSFWLGYELQYTKLSPLGKLKKLRALYREIFT